MGTRGCIARVKGPGQFEGRYHHWDSYPTGLGATLYKAYHGHFKKDLPAMLKYLIDDHPAGWSTINKADFSQAPGYEEGGFETKGPNCYCHGGRSDDAWLVTQSNASDSGVEYTYAFDVEHNAMLVLSSYIKKSGAKMIGMFGSGAKAKDVEWTCIGAVKLDEPEPNWSVMGEEKAA
jgi:hypothetical protein